MSICDSSVDRRRNGHSCTVPRSIEVELNEEVLAAVEGWRQAHGMADRSEALGELVVLGLMSEIRKIYRMATGARDSAVEARSSALADGDDADGMSRYGAHQPGMGRR